MPDDLATARKKSSAPPSAHRSRHPVRFVTAAALFDGHDASINIIRRMLQASGVEVIHLGHNRAVDDVLEAALQEDANGIAVSSYQGGHVEYFKYLLDRLRERGAPEIRVFGGGGGVIVGEEIADLQQYGVCRIYSPEDGRRMGLQGMIDDMIRQADFDIAAELPSELSGLASGNRRHLARIISALENGVLDE
ncbi:MAG: cobalamin-dependent protein, partial [Bacteroidota bacterium]